MINKKIFSRKVYQKVTTAIDQASKSECEAYLGKNVLRLSTPVFEDELIAHIIVSLNNENAEIDSVAVMPYRSYEPHVQYDIVPGFNLDTTWISETLFEVSRKYSHMYSPLFCKEMGCGTKGFACNIETDSGKHGCIISWDMNTGDLEAIVIFYDPMKEVSVDE